MFAMKSEGTFPPNDDNFVESKANGSTEWRKPTSVKKTGHNESQ